MNQIGIYKITSPSNKVYVGQSININARFKSYLRLSSNKKQSRLYNSFLKYGIINHKFEILEECNIELLNERERHYQDLYDVIGKNGLNCRLTFTNDKSGVISNETKLKLKNTSSKKVIDVLHNIYYYSAKECALKNNIEPYILRNKLNHTTINDTFFLYENEIPMEGINYNCVKITSKDKKIINVETGKIYYSLIKCCKQNNLNYSTLKRKLNGGRKNNTCFKYLSENDYLIIKYKELLTKALNVNKLSPFNIYDSEYIEILREKILKLEIK